VNSAGQIIFVSLLSFIAHRIDFHHWEIRNCNSTSSASAESESNEPGKNNKRLYVGNIVITICLSVYSDMM
jgi:hypothetical protein